VLLVWLAAVIAAAVAIGGWLGAALTTDDDFTGMPESRRAQALIDEEFPRRAGEFRADEAVNVRSGVATVDDPAFRRSEERRGGEGCRSRWAPHY